MAEKNTRIQLAHGGGGRLTDTLLHDIVLKHLPSQPALLDAAELNLDGASRIAFTTDSYVVSPIFFPGGDLGKLAVYGTCNDLAVTGAKPIALSLALIIEEGFELASLERLMVSVAEASRHADVTIVTGDTKVVSRGQADGIYINTAGIGRILPQSRLGFDRIVPGDKILLSGTIGDHGLAIMAKREGLSFDTPIESDAAPLADLANELIEELADGVRFMRDPTRAGLAGVLVDIARDAGRGVLIREDVIPKNPSTLAAAEVLGLDLLTVANEGKLVAVIDPEQCDHALQICRKYEKSSRAAIIGQISDQVNVGQVVMITSIGGRRIVQKPYGEQLPRIC
jgi:hydrogenase expression/formation protein HypE